MPAILKPFLTDNRRDIMGRTLFDTWKLLVPASLASGLFFRYNSVVTAFGVAALLLIFVLAAALLPAEKEGGK